MVDIEVQPGRCALQGISEQSGHDRAQAGLAGKLATGYLGGRVKGRGRCGFAGAGFVVEAINDRASFRPDGARAFVVGWGVLVQGRETGVVECRAPFEGFQQRPRRQVFPVEIQQLIDTDPAVPGVTHLLCRACGQALG